MAFEKFLSLFHRSKEVVSEPIVDKPSHPLVRDSVFSTDTKPFLDPLENRSIELDMPNFTSFTSAIRLIDGNEDVSFTFDEALNTYAMDSISLKENFTLNQGSIPNDLFNWFARQSFIGYQACGLIGQHWLVNKALTIPAEDAFRNGFEIVTHDGKLELDSISRLIALDKSYRLNRNMIECEINRRRFGFRVVIYIVESDDPDYYRKPFNIDGVMPGSYKGMSQVDPNWIAPILDDQAVANPASMDFYEPTWWMISGQLYHKSHLEIVRYIEPADVLKPMYQYGGIPLTQLILERVYAAERTANEAPMLTETKRLNVIYTDIQKVTANPGGFEEKLSHVIKWRDNYGFQVLGLEDRIDQEDTSLADLDSVIMTQYQLVAAVAGVPSTKLLGTSPKGFNATGEYEDTSYHESLESIQIQLTDIVDHHHRLVIRSEMPDCTLNVSIDWNSVGTKSEHAKAEINLLKAQTDLILLQTGSIDGLEIRNRLIADSQSGYNMLEAYDDEDFEMQKEDDDDPDIGLKGLGGVQSKSPSMPQVSMSSDSAQK